MPAKRTPAAAKKTTEPARNGAAPEANSGAASAQRTSGAKKATTTTAKSKSAAPGTDAAPGSAPKPDLTAAELRQIRVQLQSEFDVMQAEYDQSVLQLNDLQQTHTDGAGDDQADVGSMTFEREQEQSITANRHDLLIQIEHALGRIDAGTYGLCENCGNPIPKARLLALPMATLDAACKAREERH